MRRRERRAQVKGAMNASGTPSTKVENVLQVDVDAAPALRALSSALRVSYRLSLCPLGILSCAIRPLDLTVVPATIFPLAPACRSIPILLDQQRRLATYDAFVDTATVSVAEAS